MAVLPQHQFYGAIAIIILPTSTIPPPCAHELNWTVNTLTISETWSNVPQNAVLHSHPLTACPSDTGGLHVHKRRHNEIEVIATWASIARVLAMKHRKASKGCCVIVVVTVTQKIIPSHAVHCVCQSPTTSGFQEINCCIHSYCTNCPQQSIFSHRQTGINTAGGTQMKCTFHNSQIWKNNSMHDNGYTTRYME